MMKHKRAARRMRKAPYIVLSGCIAASMVSSASALELQQTCLKANASERLQIMELPKIPEAPKTAAALRTPAALQAPAASPVLDDLAGTEDLSGSAMMQARAVSAAYRIYDEAAQAWMTASASCIPVSFPAGSVPLVLETGWYIVNDNITADTGITVSGDVHLILVDGCTLHVGGIQVSDATGSLSIYAQSEDNQGSIVSTAAKDAAGIGGGSGEANGPIRIYGGNITASGGENAAGIGGGKDGAGKDITIYGGVITAQAGTGTEPSAGGGAGIGGGNGGAGTNITINGGTVNAKGTEIDVSDGNASIGGGAGIGGGNNGVGSGICIHNGNVTAEGSALAAGIGGGYNCKGDHITINGGEVSATGGAAGIGGGKGDNGSGEFIVINGGNITAESSDKSSGGAGIGGGNGPGKNITITGGNITATGSTGSAGIGGSYNAAAGDIVISGGNITAAGGNTGDELGGAGIGGGAYNPSVSGAEGESGRIEITGGMITAIGGRHAAAIGGGCDMKAESISIKNAVITVGMHADSASTLPLIGSGGDPQNNGAPVSTALPEETDCIIFNIGKNTGTASGDVYGTFVSEKDTFKDILNIPAGTTLTIPQDGALKINGGCSLINRGTIVNDGQLVLANEGCLQNFGTLTGNGSFYFAFANENFSPEDLYRAYNGSNQAEEIKNHIKSKVENTVWDIKGVHFKMRQEGDMQLPEEIRMPGTYHITYGDGMVTFTVTPAPLKIESAVPVRTSKTYDGSDEIRIQSVTFSGVYNNEKVDVDVSQAIGILNSKAPGKYNSAVLRGLKLIGEDAANYILLTASDAVLDTPSVPLETTFVINAVSTGPSSATAVPAPADSYIQYPAVKQPYLKNKSSISGWTQIRQHADRAAAGTSLAVDMNGTSKVPKEMLQSIKGRDITLILDMGNNMAWEVRGLDLASDPADIVDFTVSCKTDNIPSDLITMISSNAIGRPVYRIQTKQKETFGFPVTLTIQTGVENAGLYANLYRVSGTDGAGTYTSSVRIDADGSIKLSFTDITEYMIVLDGKSHISKEDTEPAEVVYEARMQADGSIHITASDGSVVSDMLVTATDGNTYYADAKGTAARNQIIKANGKKYFAKENGAVAQNEFCRTQKGSLVYAQADRTLASYRVITANGRKYYAKGNCAIAKSGFFTTKKGSLIYARSSGEMITGQIFRVKGSLYYAKPSGAIAKNGFYKTTSKDKIYASSSGKLMAGKLFRVNGKRFYADKNGIVAKNKWVSTGGKKYYCSAAYKITKIKTITY